MSELIRVLLIEDELDYARSLQERLAREAHQSAVVRPVGSLQEGLSVLAKGEADVVLLDLYLPESRGLETYERIVSQAPEIPVVILTAVDNDALALEAVRQGAQDFVVKGQVDGKLLFRIIRYAIERHRMQAALRSLSMLDELTGLYNRRGFLRLAEQHMKLANRTKRALLLMLVDVDGLKRINDTHGHAMGDQALKEAGEVLRGTFRTSDVIARIGGDEFAVIAIDAAKHSTDVLTRRLTEKLAAANARPGRAFKLALSVGIVGLEPTQESSLEQVMTLADQALYEQKRQKLERESKSA